MLVLRGLTDVIGFYNQYQSEVLPELIAEFETIMKSSDYLSGAPFKKIILGIVSRYQNDSVPTYKRRRRSSNELEAWIEIDFRPIQAAKRDEVKTVTARATYLALLDIGKKHGLHVQAFRRCAVRQFPFLKYDSDNCELQPASNAYLEDEINAGRPRIEVKITLRNGLSTELEQLNDLEDRLAVELNVRSLGLLEGHFTTDNSRQFTILPVGNLTEILKVIRNELMKLDPVTESSLTVSSSDSGEVIVQE